MGTLRGMPDLTTPGAAKRGLELMLHLVPRTQERQPFLTWRIKWAFVHLARSAGDMAALQVARDAVAHLEKVASNER
jgi:hypothetical protein